MKKPAKRAILLEDVLADLIQVEETLLQLELSDPFDALTDKQTRLYTEVLGRIRELVQDLSNEVAEEYRAA
jgi:hypothetical protein